jgi:trans-aconitate methyltransferase
MDKKSYQDFVFDFNNKQLVGDFERMYQNEALSNYDSWSQDEDSVSKQLDLGLLSSIQFKDCIDIGCGKGKFTKMLSDTFQVSSIGYDISKTAVDLAQKRYPELTFYVNSFEKNLPVLESDLVVFRAVLYYMKNWREVLEAAENSKYLLIGLNIPENTLGTIHSYDEFDEFITQKWTSLCGYNGLDGTSRVRVYKKIL